ncbi:MAG: 1-phosphofructokinase family hexose kinase [Propionibacteriales bacterium]|nr:1-phosphofructokinase family hexose kinase [Propionibacteriales bacterium]
MIVTLTANPSVDRTMQLDSPIVRGDVFRAVSVGDEAGGKGVNVARVVAHAGVPAVAVLPADNDDLLIKGLIEAGVHPVNVPVGRPSRVNITVTEPDGTTTKFNDPGHSFSEAVLAEVEERLLERSRGDDWVVLSGSLPPGAPVRWYADLTARLKEAGRRVAIDTSGAPLVAAVAQGRHLPDLLKPNAEELASLTGDDWTALEADPVAAAGAAGRLVADGIEAVLLTLGSEGAVLISREGSWRATPPKITLKSTVGAGDSSLAGYLLADLRGLAAPDRLREAVAYGAAAASLPGSTMPRESDLNRDDVVVTELTAAH